jgi:hypothetical protein
MTESIITTGVIDAKQQHDVMTADNPNAFAQTDADQKIGQSVIMKICGKLTNMLVELSPETYAKHVFYEGNSKIVCVVMERAL